MINPTPVDSKSTPYSRPPQYSATAPVVPPPLPRTLSQPLLLNEKPSPWRKIFLLSLLSLLVAGGTYAFAQYNSLKNAIIVDHEGESSSILSYSSQNKGKLDPALFKKAGDGRFNIVVVGVGGAGHPGGSLTDSIQVISLDTINKQASLTSIPRDFYYKGSKINSVYQFAEEKKAGSGPLAVKEAVGAILGIKISNFGLIDFDGAKDAIDALGGIDVNVPKAIYDPYFPDDRTVGYSPFNITAGQHHMDGHAALRYARSRETTSDFDRSARQQLIMQAMKKKALSLGVLSNPVKISNLMNVLGKHVKTDMQLNDIKALASIYKDVTNENTTSQVLDTSSALGLLTSTTDPVAGYISYPILGYTKYSDIQLWFQKNSPDPLLKREQPTVSLINGASATQKQLNTLADALKDYGFTVTIVSEKPSKGKYTKTQVFEVKRDKKPFSRNYLASYLSTTSQVGSPLDTETDFEVIYIPSSD